MSSDQSTPSIIENHDTVIAVCEYLDQKDLVALAVTCKALHMVVCKSLYANIYIHGEAGPMKSVEQAPKYIKSTFSRWSILFNHLRGEGNTLRLFERSLNRNPHLVGYIKRISTNDPAFVLINLNRWTRFFSGKHRLRSFRFCNAKVSHYLHTYNSLSSFHRSPNILTTIRDLQVRDIKELALFVKISRDNGKKLRLDSLSLYSCDVEIGHETGIDEDLQVIFEYLHAFEVESVDGNAMSLLITLNQYFSGKKLFPRVKRLSLNHVHSKPRSHGRFELGSTLPLDFSPILKNFNCELINSWTLKVGCLVCSQGEDVTIENFLDQGTVKCDCLYAFFDELLHHGVQVRNLYIQRRGFTPLQDPLNVYLYKKSLLRLLKGFSQSTKALKSLRLDTRCELYSAAHEQIAHLKTLFATLNGLIVDNIKIMNLNKLVLDDFFEAYTIWGGLATYDSEKALMASLGEHCDDCQVAFEKFEEMVSINSKIQFYLDPTLHKTMDEFRFDLAKKILSYIRNPSLVTLSEHDTINPPKVTDIPVIHCPEDPQVCLAESSNWFLHESFKHESFKDLVSNNFSRLRGSFTSHNNYTVKCKCRGNELAYFSQLIAHGLDVEFPFRDVILNGLAA